MIARDISCVEDQVKNYHESYQIALNALIKDYEAVETDKDRIKVIEKFAEKYTVISYIWFLFHGLHEFKGRGSLLKRNEIKLKNLSHLYSHLWFLTYRKKEDHEKFFGKILNYHYSAIKDKKWNEKSVLEKLRFIEKIKQSLLFPHHYSLKQCYKEYIKFTPDTEEQIQLFKIQFEHNRGLHKQIKYKKDDDEWFESVKKTDDIKFIIQNTEYRIGQTPQNKKMWCLYLDYLKENNLTDLMLDVYRRYCRFFTCDKEMFGKYKIEIDEAAKSNQNIRKWQLDAIKFENDFNSIEAAIALFKKFFREESFQIDETNFEEILTKMLSEISTQPANLNYVIADIEIKLSRKSTKMHFNGSNSEHIFPLTISNYILKKLTPKILEKLYKTSKYFYALYGINICSMLDIGLYPSTVTYKRGLFYSKKDQCEIKKLYLTSKFFVNDKKNPSILSSMIPRIYKSEISMMFLFHQNLTMKEFLFLRFNVSELLFNDTKVICENQEIACVPELVEKLPNLEKATFYELQYPAFPFGKESVNCSNKLKNFKIKNFLGPHDLDYLNEFLKSFECPSPVEIKIKSNSITDDQFNKIERILKRQCFPFWKSKSLERYVTLGNRNHGTS